MGNSTYSCISNAYDSRASHRKKICQMMFPVYFIKEEITSDEILLAQESWDLVKYDNSPSFEHLTATSDDFPYFSCLEWFQVTFYDRLFDVHPVSLCYFIFLDLLIFVVYRFPGISLFIGISILIIFFTVLKLGQCSRILTSKGIFCQN